MTQEEKQILLKDLCERLPYRPLVQDEDAGVCLLQTYMVNDLMFENPSLSIKPYLRPMSSMTDKDIDSLNEYVGGELYEFDKAECVICNATDFHYEPIWVDHTSFSEVIDWLNANHFDYRGLIEKGLALEAPEDMYEIKYLV